MPVAQSSHIQTYDYDPDTRTLTIQFTNGALYNYNGVDANTYYAFAQSNSPGSYFHTKIKGQFASVLLSPGPRKKRK